MNIIIRDIFHQQNGTIDFVKEHLDQQVFPPRHLSINEVLSHRLPRISGENVATCFDDDTDFIISFLSNGRMPLTKCCHSYCHDTIFCQQNVKIDCDDTHFLLCRLTANFTNAGVHYFFITLRRIRGIDTNIFW